MKPNRMGLFLGEEYYGIWKKCPVPEGHPRTMKNLNLVSFPLETVLQVRLWLHRLTTNEQ